MLPTDLKIPALGSNSARLVRLAAPALLTGIPSKQSVLSTFNYHHKPEAPHRPMIRQRHHVPNFLRLGRICEILIEHPLLWMRIRRRRGARRLIISQLIVREICIAPEPENFTIIFHRLHRVLPHHPGSSKLGTRCGNPAIRNPIHPLPR